MLQWSYHISTFGLKSVELLLKLGCCFFQQKSYRASKTKLYQVENNAKGTVLTADPVSAYCCHDIRFG